MKLHRRTFLHLGAGVAVLPFAPRIARAQAYPSRPVRILVGYTAGGPTDIFARLMPNRSPTGSTSNSSSRTVRVQPAR